MRTTVDIPDGTYRLLKSRAATEGSTVKQLLLRGAETVLQQPARRGVCRLKEPPLNKGVPGSLHLTNEIIYDLIDFP